MPKYYNELTPEDLLNETNIEGSKGEIEKIIDKIPEETFKTHVITYRRIEKDPLKVVLTKYELEMTDDHYLQVKSIKSRDVEF